MAAFSRFEDIEAWKDCRKLTGMIYRATQGAAFSCDRALTDQMRRAAVSTVANIAEGFERRTPAEFRHYLSIAKGSCGELRSLLYVALDEGYVDDARFAELHAQALLAIKRISALIRYLSNRS
jgi:four helix bundle protein